MNSISTAVFDRSGLAALSDLKTKEWTELFSVLEKEQSVFQERGAIFFDEAYPWPHDPLRQFSRVWEYPYIYHHILKLKNDGLIRPNARIADLGSGVTFFPFSVSKLGFEVICIDNDIICKQNMLRAIKAFARDGMNVSFKLSSDHSIPLPDGFVDILYCISVLEHVRELEPLVDEIARVLTDEGFLLLTVDIDLLSDLKPNAKRFSEFGIERFYNLMSYLGKNFDLCYPETTVHPSDLLHSGVGPFPIRNPQGMALFWFVIKQMVKPLFGRKPSAIPKKICLTVDGLILRKRKRP